MIVGLSINYYRIYYILEGESNYPKKKLENFGDIIKTDEKLMHKIFNQAELIKMPTNDFKLLEKYANSIFE